MAVKTATSRGKALRIHEVSKVFDVSISTERKKSSVGQKSMVQVRTKVPKKSQKK